MVSSLVANKINTSFPQGNITCVGPHVTELIFEFYLSSEGLRLKVLQRVCKVWNKVFEEFISKKLNQLTPFELQAYDVDRAKEFINKTKSWIAAIPKPVRLRLFLKKDIIPVVASIARWNFKRIMSAEAVEAFKKQGYNVDEKMILIPLLNDAPELSGKEGDLVDYCYSNHGHFGTPGFNAPSFLPYDIVKRCLDNNSKLLLKFKEFRVEMAFKSTCKNELLRLVRRATLEPLDRPPIQEEYCLSMVTRNTCAVCFQEDIIAEIKETSNDSIEDKSSLKT